MTPNSPNTNNEEVPINMCTKERKKKRNEKQRQRNDAANKADFKLI
jgi:hypothetical protein